MHHCTSTEVIVNSRCLEDFFSRERVRLPADEFNQIAVAPETLSGLSDWAAGKSPSEFLWIDGPNVESDDTENPMTVLAAKFIELADSLDNPAASYFCQLSRTQPEATGETREQRALTALTFALLRQIIELLPPQFRTDVDFTETMFKALDTTAASRDTALNLISAILELVPGKVLFVIDGIHWLDNQSTDKQLIRLVHILRHRKAGVLLTSSGRSKVLQQEIPSEATIVIDVVRPKGATELLCEHGF